MIWQNNPHNDWTTLLSEWHFTASFAEYLYLIFIWLITLSINCCVIPTFIQYMYLCTGQHTKWRRHWISQWRHLTSSLMSVKRILKLTVLHTVKRTVLASRAAPAPVIQPEQLATYIVGFLWFYSNVNLCRRSKVSAHSTGCCQGGKLFLFRWWLLIFLVEVWKLYLISMFNPAVHTNCVNCAHNILWHWATIVLQCTLSSSWNPRIPL